MSKIEADVTLDAKGLACPMPIVKTKKAMASLETGQVLEVQATDKGSKADIAAWAGSTGHQYIGTIEADGVLKHFLRKSSPEETAEREHPHVISNEELQKKLEAEANITVIDVREVAEYAFGHIPQAVSIPMGELENRISELDKQSEIYVVCRTGNRSDLAAQKLEDLGFGNVKNVVPGMNQWTGKTANINDENTGGNDND